MSIMDAKLELSDGQGVATADGVELPTAEYVDFGADGKDGWGRAETPDVGKRGKLVAHINVSSILVGAGGALHCFLRHDTDPVFGAEVALITFPIIAAESVAGTRVSVPLPGGTINRYVRGIFKAVGANITGGNCDFYLAYEGEEGVT